MERRGFWRESFAQSLEWFFGTMQPNIRRLMARRRSRDKKQMIHATNDSSPGFETKTRYGGQVRHPLF